VTPKIPNVRSVFAVGNNTFAVKTDGTFWGWGSGSTGQWPFNADVRLPTAIAVP
jgi:alpha-tubulin suppressor-like RCC1 family protein